MNDSASIGAGAPLRCVLIGGESLLIQCADILLRQGHPVAAVVSSEPAIADWAASHGIRTVPFDVSLADSLRGALANEPFDYLFSIANLRVIPADVLALPLRGAINFHDGPLPRYAGLHATSWALLHGERQHGVTWHAIAGGIDEGDILAQELFEIEDDERALTLNAKCYEAGIRTFESLVRQLADGTVRPLPQALDRRTYFGAFKRPSGVGHIDWRRPAAEIDALVRALDFGGYANPLALPHASINGRPFLVTALDMLDERSGDEPGTIVGVDDQGIRVATATEDVRLTRVSRDDGYLQTAGEFAVKAGLTDTPHPALSPQAGRGVTDSAPGAQDTPSPPEGERAGVRGRAVTQGARLDTLADDLIQRLTSIHERAARHEQFWVTRLAKMAPLDLPFAPVEALSRKAATRRRSDLVWPPALASMLTSAFSSFVTEKSAAADTFAADMFAAVTLAWLARLTDAPVFDVEFADTALRHLTEGVDRWFAASVPLRVEPARDRPLAAQIQAVTAEISELRRRQTFTRDLAARQPSLKAMLTPAAKRTRWAVKIELVETLDPAGAASTAGEAVPPTSPLDAALTIRIASDGRSAWLHDPEVMTDDVIRRMQAQLLAFATDGLTRSEVPAGQLTILPEDERGRILVEWNQTAVDYDTASCIDEAIAAQAARAPERVAVVSRATSITYADLDARADAVARHLRTLGVGPGVIVGLAAARSIDLMVGLLGILKAGGAYLPLDPDYPADRLAFMIDDSRAPIVVTQRAFAGIVPANVTAVMLDGDSAYSETPHPSPLPASPHPNAHKPRVGDPGGARGSQDLAYVIYTSGSTGKPKGVMVTHRNVMNFAAAMDERLENDRDGTWLAVTSLSFDISVLELLWTLARGFTVVVHGGASRAAHRAPGAAKRSPVAAVPRRHTHAGQLQFSLFYFSSDEGEEPGDRYHLLLEGAAFADREDFTAVWTPERHFHSFGGLYPNPSVISAAIAATTTGVDIRAGSVVLPLHHPARVVEEWSVVDNLSRGRVGISFASGWQPNDFILRPENFRDAKAVMMRGIEVVRRLWRGEKVAFPGPKGDDISISTLPRPVQSELPVWITTAGNPETFRMAGEAGAYVLTHLLGQSVKELGAKLDAYREAWRAAGHAGEPHVTLMLHTFIGDDVERVRETVRGPMKKYLASSVSLIKDHASSFPAFRNVGGGGSGAGAGGASQNLDALFAQMTPEDLDGLLDYSFSRYFETGGLFGTPESVAPMIDSLNAIGVDEIACLIDFGVPADQVLAGLKPLKAVRDRYASSKPASAPAPAVVAAAAGDDDYSLAGELTRHRVTHLQCTPSLAALLVADPASRAALTGLRRMLVGGEALSPVLAQQLREATAATLINMYGPTETTVWSTSHAIDGASSTVPIGRPIGNTQCYILDRAAQPVPIGVAGELYIGGDGVTRGYLHRPELTSERFVVNPFASNHDSRLYRTGDLTRYRADGVIEFLGRLDHQVKIRGHRIELGEIETALRAVDGLREAVVILREDTPGDARLVGYVSIADGRTLDVEAVRRGLTSVLPDIMVPSRLVVLERLPLTPNGKIDRRALPVPEAAGPVSSPSAQIRADGNTQQHLRPGADVSASGDIESVSGIWRDVLRLPSVGLDDNFFDLGGHSLLAVQVLGLVRERLGRTIPITDLFRFPTVRLMARHLEGGASSSGSAALDRARARADARRQGRQRRPVADA